MPFIGRTAYLVFYLFGLVVIFLPILRELDPGHAISKILSLEQFLALELYAALIAFWAHAAYSSQSTGHQIYAAILAVISAVTGLWITQFFDTTNAVFLTPTPAVIGFGCTAIALVLLAGFRAGGSALTLIVAAALALGFFGQFFPDLIYVPQTHFTSYVTYLAYGSDGLFGRALDIISNIVLVFLIFGVFFNIAGGGAVVANVALRLAKGNPASAIKACVIASGLFGTVSGGVTSNVMTSGTFSIPAMRRTGVSNDMAAGIEAAASTCGQIMPPVLGAAAFYLANLVGVAYSTVVIAAIGPALGCYFAFFRQADLVPRDESKSGDGPDLEPMSRNWLLYLLPPAAIFFFIMKSNVYVSTAAIAGTVTSLAVAGIVLGHRETMSRIRDQFPILITSAINLIVVAATVGLLMGVLYSTGLAIAGAVWIGNIADQNLLLALALTAFATLVLGMGVATVGVYIVAATLLAPGLISAGIPPLAAHFFVLYCGILSMITPPVAFASLAASTLAKSDFSTTSIMALRFGWIMFAMPFAIALKPGILMIGSWAEIVTAFFVITVFILAATSNANNWRIRFILTALAAFAICWTGQQAVSLLLAGGVASAMFFQNFRARILARNPERLARVKTR